MIGKKTKSAKFRTFADITEVTELENVVESIKADIRQNEADTAAANAESFDSTSLIQDAADQRREGGTMVAVRDVAAERGGLLDRLRNEADILQVARKDAKQKLAAAKQRHRGELLAERQPTADQLDRDIIKARRSLADALERRHQHNGELIAAGLNVRAGAPVLPFQFHKLRREAKAMEDKLS